MPPSSSPQTKPATAARLAGSIAMPDREQHVTLLPPPRVDERQPLLNTAGPGTIETDSEGEPVYSCVCDAHSRLHVYTNIHRVRRDIVSAVEDYLSLEQLRDVRINLSVVRPLVDQLYALDDVSIGEPNSAALCLCRHRRHRRALTFSQSTACSSTAPSSWRTTRA